MWLCVRKAYHQTSMFVYMVMRRKAYHKTFALKIPFWQCGYACARRTIKHACLSTWLCDARRTTGHSSFKKHFGNVVMRAQGVPSNTHVCLRGYATQGVPQDIRPFFFIIMMWLCNRKAYHETTCPSKLILSTWLCVRKVFHRTTHPSNTSCLSYAYTIVATGRTPIKQVLFVFSCVLLGPLPIGTSASLVSAPIPH